MKTYTVGMRTKSGIYIERVVVAVSHADAAKKARTLYPEDVLLSTEGGSMTPIPSITDDLLRELEAEYRATENTQQLSLIRRLRESEARLWSMCVAVTQKDVERVKRETCNNLDYLRGHAAGGD